MDYPLSKKELDEIKENISLLDCSVYDMGRAHTEWTSPFVIDFLLKYHYAKESSAGKGVLSEWANTIELTHSKESVIKEIERCNKKAKEASWQEWKIAIVSAVIGGIFGLIGSLILA